MEDERLGVRGKSRPNLTVCGNPVEEQFLFSIGIGGGNYVIVGYGDNHYESEIENLKATLPKPIVRVHKQRGGAIGDEQKREDESNS